MFDLGIVDQRSQCGLLGQGGAAVRAGQDVWAYEGAPVYRENLGCAAQASNPWYLQSALWQVSARGLRKWKEAKALPG